MQLSLPQSVPVSGATSQQSSGISPVPAPGPGDNARADESEGSNLEPNKGKSKKTLAQPESQLLEEGLGFLLALQML